LTLLVAALPVSVTKKPMDILENYTGSVKTEPPAGQLTKVDHGMSPAKPDPKRMRLGSPHLPEKTPCPKQSTPVHEDRCCNCTKMSTCQTKHCECLRAQQPCMSCDCFNWCQNHGGYISLCEFIQTSAPEEDDSLDLARVLNLSPPRKKIKDNIRHIF
jgi:hypothetical protein